MRLPIIQHAPLHRSVIQYITKVTDLLWKETVLTEMVYLSGN